MPSGTFRTAGCVSFRPGTFPCGRGHSTPSGTGFLSPNAQAVPDREGMHPHAQDVPAGELRNPVDPGNTPDLIPVWYHLLLWRHGDDIALEQRG